MKKVFKLGCMGFICLIVLGIIVAARSSGDSDSGEEKASNEPKQETASSNKDSKSKDKEGVLTEEKFEQIKDGMTYEEVVKVVGSEGSLLSETGEKDSDFHTVIYEFETDGFLANANMTFQGGKLMNKSQFGLGGGSDVEMTLEQFNQIENGMTLEEVIEIVGGEGEIVSETGEEGTDLHTVMYSYQGEGNIGANVSLMFQGNKLENKTQTGLE